MTVIEVREILRYGWQVVGCGRGQLGRTKIYGGLLARLDEKRLMMARQAPVGPGLGPRILRSVREFRRHRRREPVCFSESWRHVKQELNAGASVLSRLEGIVASGPAASRIRQPAFHGISAYRL
jgi:hypothetical protein